MTTPVLPPTLHQRPISLDDAEVLAGLVTAVEGADQRGDHRSVADLAEMLTEPGLDLAHDSVLVLDGEEPVAHQVLRLVADGDRHVVHAGAAVHPRVPQAGHRDGADRAGTAAGRGARRHPARPGDR